MSSLRLRITWRANCVTCASSTARSPGCQSTLGSNDPTVFPADGDRRGARPAVGRVVGPVGEPVRPGGIAAVAGRLAGMLDVDECSAVVGRGVESGDLAAARPGEE